MITAAMAEEIIRAVKAGDADALADALAEAVYACEEDEEEDDDDEGGPGILIGVARKKK